MDGGDTANYMLQMWSFMNGWAASRDNANGSGGVENIELNGNVAWNMLLGDRRRMKGRGADYYVKLSHFRSGCK